MERVDDLQTNGLTLVQDDELYCFTGDAVLLADFARLGKGSRVCDFGAGSGILSILLASKRPSITVEAVELQPGLAGLARRNVLRNGLEARIRVHEGDLREFSRRLTGLDAVVCNPPYFGHACALTNENPSRAHARHELDLTLEELCEAAARSLKSGGRFFLCYPAERFCELVCRLSAHRLEPKRVRPVQVRSDRAPHLFLTEARRDGGRGAVWLPPLLLEEGTEVSEIYARTKKEEA